MVYVSAGPYRKGDEAPREASARGERMKLDIRVRGLESPGSLREHAARRVHYHLSRFGPAVTGVVVRVDDINGPKGGVDMRCQVTVRGRHFAPRTTEDLRADAYAAVDTALELTARAIGRELERRRNQRRADATPRGSPRAVTEGRRSSSTNAFGSLWMSARSE